LSTIAGMLTQKREGCRERIVGSLGEDVRKTWVMLGDYKQLFRGEPQARGGKKKNQKKQRLGLQMRSPQKKKYQSVHLKPR